MTMIRNGLVVKVVALLRFPMLSLGYTHIIYNFHSQRFFEIKTNVDFYFETKFILFMKTFEVPRRRVK